jgi:hypothetical protein
MRMRLLAVVWLVGVIGICSSGWAAEPRFRMTVLMQDWEDLERAQTWEEAWPRLRKASGAPFFTIDERDVAAYDWQAQRIVLRPEVSLRVLEAAQRLPRVSDRIRRLKALWSTDDLWEAVDKRGFLVSLGGEPLYGGIFLRKDSQLSMDYPVIHTAMDEDRRIVLRFSPSQFSFGSLWDDGSGDALEDGVHPAVREFREVFPDVKERLGEDNWKRIESFKRRIQDPRIQAVFAGLKTPAQAPLVAKVERLAPAQPVLIGATPYSRDPQEGWSLYFSWPDAVSEVRYRRAGDGKTSEWGAASDQGQARLGRLYPGRYKIDIEAIDWAGEVAGRYVFGLDPEREALFSDKILLEETSSWVSFYDGEKGDTASLYFMGLRGHGDALREIRYSLDGCSLDRRFPMSFEGIDGKEKYYEPVPPETVFACIQLVYRDGEATAPRRFPHHDAEPEPAPSEPAASPVPSPGPQPVSLSILGRSQGWRLYLDLEEGRSARAIRYRFGNDSEWSSTRPDVHVNLLTGERFPSQIVWLSPEKVQLGRHRLEVKLTDWNGVESGPYVLWFDLEAEIVKEGLDFMRLFSSRDALREIRYSLDGCALDQRLPFRPWTRLGDVPADTESFFIRSAKGVQSVCVQLVFRDGEVSEPRQYFRKPPPAP